MIYSPRAARSVHKSHIPSLPKNNPYLLRLRARRANSIERNYGPRTNRDNHLGKGTPLTRTKLRPDDYIDHYVACLSCCPYSDASDVVRKNRQ